MRRVVALPFVALAAGCGGHGSSLPYRTVDYSPSQARVAFTGVGVSLVRHEHRAPITDFSTRDAALEVTVFGVPKAVEATGFEDLDRGPSCTKTNRLALRWHGNVRAIVNCDLVRDDPRWARLVDRAFARLVV